MELLNNLTDLQKSIIGLTSMFVVLPAIAAFTLWKIINLVPEKYLERLV